MGRVNGEKKFEMMKGGDGGVGSWVICMRCKVGKGGGEFYRNRMMASGLSNYCKVCTREYAKQREAIIVSKYKENPELMKQEDVIKRIVMCLMENPKRGLGEIARLSGVTVGEVQRQMRKNEYMRAVHLLGTRELKNLIPLAVGGLRESLKSSDEDVKLRSSMEVLKSEGVMGPTRVEVSGGVGEMTAGQLREVIAKVRDDLPEQTIIEAEVVG